MIIFMAAVLTPTPLTITVITPAGEPKLAKLRLKLGHGDYFLIKLVSSRRDFRW
jgi:hypothetical protein